MKNLAIKATMLLVLALCAVPLRAQDKVSLRTNFFSDNSGTTVQSPAVEIAKKIVGKMKFLLRYALDRVSVPPVRGIAATPSPTDAVTGASRPVSGDEPATSAFTKERNEVIAGVELPGLSLSFYHSKESDYVGRMATVSTNLDFNRKNTNLSLSYNYGWDRIEPLGTDTLHTKTTHHLNATLTQALSPVMIGRAGIDLSYVSGFQSNPYRTVNAGGQILLENHPLARSRGAFFLKLNRYFQNRSSLQAEYRYYRDDWKIQSHTLNFYYYQYVSDKVLIRYRYRYYDQGQAFFYRRTYSTIPKYFTSDYKNEPFTAHLFGLKIEYQLKDLVKDGFFSFLSSSTFEAKYERYFSSNDFTADIFQFGLVFNY
ncbi:MAG: DUF3570 domain-containing protein [Calditrichaeota bacterium]|nr:MAG: DUF3570 domain-containing protein [Calditrichota bacterium]